MLFGQGEPVRRWSASRPWASRVLSLTLAGAMLAACGGSGSKSSAPTTPSGNGGSGNGSNPNGTLTAGYDFSQFGGFNFDPSLSTTPVDSYLQQLVHGGLFRSNADGSISPDLASGYTVVAPTVVDVTLHPNLVFDDGTPLTADVVKAAIQYTATSTGASVLSVIKPPTKPGGLMSSIDVLSPTKLQFTLTAPDAGQLLAAFARQEGVIIDPKQIGTPGLKTAPIGAGPYKIVSYTPGSELRLTASSTYWNAKDVKIKNVTYLQNSNSGAGPVQGINRVTTGQLDYWDADYADTPSVLAANKGNVVASVTPSDSEYQWFNICKQPYKTVSAAEVSGFSDLNVRTAMNLMVDRDALNQAIYAGKGQPRTQNWLKGEANYDPSVAAAFTYDPVKAKAFMAKSAYPHGFSFTVVVNSSPISDRVAQYLQQQWAQLGIKMNILESLNIGTDWFLGLKGPAVLTQFGGLASTKLANTYDAKNGRNNACGWTQAQSYTDTINATAPNEQGALKSTWQASAANVAANQSEIMLIWGVNQAVYSKSALSNVQVMLDGIGNQQIDPTRSSLG